MKSKIFIFTTLILVVFLFVITSCDNFLNAKNKTTININLDLSKILKTSRNETTTSITDYILKVFAYNAATYKPKDEIQNLPLLTQTENKVDINGNVKASLDVEIGLNVIFVAKLYQGKSEKPLYAGKSEVIKIKATDNKVHLVLTRENADLDIDILIHDHTFAEEWTKDETHHWHAATCEHSTEVSEKSEHNFENWKVTKEPTEEAEGTRESTCTVCEYKVTEAIEKLAHTHKFATDWTKDETHHWYAAICEHTTEVSEKAAHSFGNWTTTKEATEEAEGSRERSCSVCGYTATEAIEKLAHTHKFATDWTKDATYHWYAATCEHTTEVSEKAAHTFGNWTITKEATEEAEGTKEQSCTVCEYKVTEVIAKLAHTHKFATDWTKDATYHWYAATCEHTTEVSGKAEHSFGNWNVTKEASCTEKGEKKGTCTSCGYEKTEITDKAEHSYANGVCICGLPEGFVLIPAGTFQMGSNAGEAYEKPVHEVTITKDFYMGKYEVTQAEYEKYCSYTESKSPNSSYGDGDNYPAYYVSWYDALVYCNKRSIAEGLTPCYSINDNPEGWGDVPTSSDSTWNAVECDWNANGYRLPTEAEWEYAARAGDDTVSSLTYAGTNSLSKLGEYAWYSDSSSSKTHEVGTKKANGFGLYDMSGNVYEWCWNWFTNSYNTGTEGGSDPTGASLGDRRVYRGGSWDSNSGNCTVFYRICSNPELRIYYHGFRVVRIP